jgi:hypothetical protein
MYAGLHVRLPVENTFIKIHPLEVEWFLEDTRTDMTKLNAALSSFAKAAKNFNKFKIVKDMPSFIYSYLIVQTSPNFNMNAECIITSDDV